MLVSDDWRDLAACRGMDSDIFFPGGAASRNDHYYYPDYYQVGEEAKKVCRTCPVRKPCLEFAKKLELPFGIWGGQHPVEFNEIGAAWHKCVVCKLEYPAHVMFSRGGPAPRCRKCREVIEAWRWHGYLDGKSQAWGIRIGEDLCKRHEWRKPNEQGSLL